MKRNPYLAAGLVLAALTALLLKAGSGAGVPAAGGCVEVARAPRIYPDYAGVTIPPNIAPLNFVVREPGKRHAVRISAGQGRAIEVGGREGTIEIPVGPWRALLAANRGGDLTIDVFAQGERGWEHFEPVRQHVAAEEIDSTLVYRWFRPAYTANTPLGLYQRDLEGYEQTSILRSDEIELQCVNCHTFLNRRPETFFFHLRGPNRSSAMMMMRDGKATAVDTRTPEIKSPAAYASWHPSGKFAAFSRNWIRQYFREAGDQSRDALDARSSLWLYRVDGAKSVSPPEINPPGRMPTFPGWSHDGRWLYYSSVRRFWPANDTMPVKIQPQVRYDLMRAPFDEATGTFGKAEIFLSAEKLGKSILEARVSPDGRWLVVCFCEFGSFPAFQRETDLYLVDLQSKERRPVRMEPAETSRRDSWHSWSSNSRWLVCASKRDNGLLARPYLRYIDAEGRSAKPFIVPQKDPTYYDRCLNTYNLPELVTGPVRIDRAQTVGAAMDNRERELGKLAPGTAPEVGGGASVP